MNLYSALPAAAACLMVVALALIAAPGKRRAGAWLVPALLCAAFAAWSAFAVATEGLSGFWTEHSRNAWGNQIWFDLLIGIAVAWTFIVPKARAVGMTLWPWLALILATGGIGLLAMAARYLFLRDAAAAVHQA